MQCVDTAAAASGSGQTQLTRDVRSRPPHRVRAWLRCFQEAATAQAPLRRGPWDRRAVPPPKGVFHRASCQPARRCIMILKLIKIHRYEAGLYFRDGEFRGLLEAGRHWFFDPLRRVRVEVVSQRAPWLVHEKLDVIVKSGALEGLATVVDLKDYERALVWIDGRFSHVVPPGLYAYWTTCRDVKIEV